LFELCQQPLDVVRSRGGRRQGSLRACGPPARETREDCDRNDSGLAHTFRIRHRPQTAR
jgi:hypothetical protein